MKYLMLGAAALAIAACSQEKPADTAAAPESKAAMSEAMSHEGHDMMSASEHLDAVLAAQPDDVKARYQHRHPKETLEFFGVEPGMTVVDTLPGEPGWYGEILIPYLGEDGKLIGAEYSVEMWSKFVGYATEEFLEEKKTWPEQYVASVEAAAGEDGPEAAAFVYGAAPDELAGTVDVILMVRALHHFTRIDDGAYLGPALADAYKVLKPGGVVGVVQHRAQEDTPDEWAIGNAGYVKQSAIIAAFENAGFELAGESDVNANPADRPTTEEFVWRLPPTLATSGDNPELRAQMEAIGESDRMTLKFKKPE